MGIWDNSLKICVMDLKYGCKYSKDSTVIYQFFYPKNGKFDFSSKSPNLNFSIDQNQLLFVPAKCKGVVCNYVGKPYQGITIRFRFFPNVNFWEYSPQAIPVDDEIAHALDELPLDDEFSITKIWKFYRLLSLIQAKMKRNTSKKAQALQPALDYMNTHNDYTTDSLAVLCRMSRSGFCAAFREVTGESVVEARHRIQSFKASILLYHTNLSVEEIAERVGFSSVKHFRSVFQMRYHTTPLKHRQHYRNKP